MKTPLFTTLLALVMSGCASLGPPIQNQCFHENERSEGDIGYCRAVRVGDTLYISGTAGQGDMATAIRSVYGRLQKTLQKNGLSYADVVREVVYATDLDAFIEHKELRKGLLRSESAGGDLGPGSEIVCTVIRRRGRTDRRGSEADAVGRPAPVVERHGPPAAAAQRCALPRYRSSDVVPAPLGVPGARPVVLRIHRRSRRIDRSARALSMPPTFGREPIIPALNRRYRRRRQP